MESYQTSHAEITKLYQEQTGCKLNLLHEVEYMANKNIELQWVVEDGCCEEEVSEIMAC